jgi:hypothetical protein
MSTLLKGRLLTTFICVLLLFAGFTTFVLKEDVLQWHMPDEQRADMAAVYIGGTTVSAWIADTPDERRRGLSGYATLPENQGMLFVFEEPGAYGMWMKDMNFSIDVVWISAGGVIVDVRENISPDTYPEVFTPRTSAQYVLELPADFVKTYGISVGGRVEL